MQNIHKYNNIVGKLNKFWKKMLVSKSKLRENYKTSRVIEMSKFWFSFSPLFSKRNLEINISFNNNKKEGTRILELILITYWQIIVNDKTFKII